MKAVSDAINASKNKNPAALRTYLMTFVAKELQKCLLTSQKTDCSDIDKVKNVWLAKALSDHRQVSSAGAQIKVTMADLALLLVVGFIEGLSR